MPRKRRLGCSWERAERKRKKLGYMSNINNVPSTSNIAGGEHLIPTAIRPEIVPPEEVLDNISLDESSSLHHAVQTQRGTRQLFSSAATSNAMPGSSLNQKLVEKASMTRCSIRLIERRQNKLHQRKEKLNCVTRVILHRRTLDKLPSTYNAARIQELHFITQSHSVGRMDKKCEFCHAKLFASELSANTSTICCHKGKINLPPLQVPTILQELIETNNQDTTNYLNHIRQYNNALAFASVTVENVNVAGRGPFCFKIHGQVYHSVGSLEAPHGITPAYASLFIIDSKEALQLRLDRQENLHCSSDIMSSLQNMIECVNPYAQLFSSMKDINQETQNLQLRFTLENAFDKRRYNIPTRGDEIAAVFTTVDGAPCGNFDFVVYQKATGKLARIPYLNPHSDPMCYPLLFPCGDAGWCPGMPHVEIHRTNVRNVIAQLQYYCYRLSVRDGFNLIHSSGKLFQQYIVDSYVKVEGARIAYIRAHQKELRAESYKGLVDFLHSDAEQRGLLPGVPVILPSTFIGSPRNMIQNYQDAMSIVARLGKPDIFLTFTANPKWTEITSNLKPYQTVQGRPDLVARVFYSKLQSLLEEIQKDHILGIVTAYVDVIEFQKRGLPHVHMLLILRPEDKIREPVEVDSVVCAEIPGQNDERLHSIIKQCMIHGPCGDLNSNSPCMENGQCSKGFPKEFVQDTTVNVNGYPQYRRRNNGRTITIGNCIIDNRWVVPYNPYLSVKYSAHINVEICSSVRSVKYLYKYLYKGHDCAAVHLRTNEEGQEIANFNEVDRFLNCRFVSPPEAIWRLHERPLFNKSHSIVRLPVHLHDEQFVYFHTTEQAGSNLNKESKLTAFFKLCQEDETAKEYVYPEIPEYYVWARNLWQRRKRITKCFGRMYTVNPSDKERFCLRILLLHIKGPKCFEDLRTVNGQTYQTFLEAAKILNLIDNDEEWFKCLQEAAMFQMPKQLRQLFAVICIFGGLQNLTHLWNTFQDNLAEDYIHVSNCEQGLQAALADIQFLLNQHGKSCEHFGLPEPTIPFEIQPCIPVHIEEEVKEANILFSKLNTQQNSIATEVLQAIEMRKKCSFFIDGPGGTGKTFLYKALIKLIRSQRRTVMSVAWTGIAANLLPDGRTAHSLFKLPVPLLETSVSSIKQSSREAEELRNVSLIIWDEVSMVPGQALTIVDKLLRELTGENTLFGGKIILFGGDFRQVLPVVRHGSRTTIVESTVKNNPLWQLLIKQKLHVNMRAKEDQNFSEWLLKLGEGTLMVEEPITPNTIAIPNQCLSSTENLIQDTFCVNSINDQNIFQLTETAILCPRNEDCIKINEDIVDKLVEGESQMYYSTDSVISDDKRDAQLYPQEFLNSLNPSGLPPHKLLLKKNTIVMLIRNLNTKQGLVNGTRLIVNKMTEYSIIASTIPSNINVIIPRIVLATSDPTMPFNLTRKQFPIKVAFAITINKAQGQTLNNAGLYLPSPVFSHGQLYVAFSRVKSFQNIKIAVKTGPEQQILEDKILTTNIVYKEVLQMCLAIKSFSKL